MGARGQVERLLVQAQTLERFGVVVAALGPLITAKLPDARMGEIVEIRARRQGAGSEAATRGPMLAEVVGYGPDGVSLMPLGRTEAISMGDDVVPVMKSQACPYGAGVWGRVLGPLGEPIDGGPPIFPEQLVPLVADGPAPLSRRPVCEPIQTGVRAVDMLFTVARGQRMGIFAPAGVGKSTLLAMIARGYITLGDASQASKRRLVIALIGERSREVGEFRDEVMGDHVDPLVRQQAVLVVSTSDQPAVLRLKAAYAATAIAEAARAEGSDVILMMDSLTRFARALREVGLAAGEVPVRGGFPPSLFDQLPRLLERPGNAEVGSITAFYTLLREGQHIEDPVAEEAKSLLDGHIELSRDWMGMWRPAIDVNASESRVLGQILRNDQRVLEQVRAARAAIRAYREQADLITIGKYVRGKDPACDLYLDNKQAFRDFMNQPPADSSVSRDQLLRRFEAIIGGKR